MPERPKKRPRDLNQLAKFVVDMATSTRNDGEQGEKKQEKNPAASELGRLGGLKGGRARAEKLSPEERRRIALKAATTRWKK